MDQQTILEVLASLQQQYEEDLNTRPIPEEDALMHPYVARRVVIRTAVLPALEFLMTEVQQPKAE